MGESPAKNITSEVNKTVTTKYKAFIPRFAPWVRINKLSKAMVGMDIQRRSGM